MSDPLSNNRHEGGMESPSAYASAESSPAQSMVTSLSMHSMQSQQQQHQYDECSPTRSGTMPVSQSMSCFGSSQTSSSAHHINLSTIPSSMSVTDIDTLAKLEELNMQAFTSLPPVSPKSGETVKAVIERTVKAELEKQQQTSPKISPSRSSVFSMLGRIFKSASKSTIDEKPKGGSVSPTSSTASSSSPNPESSPFKLLERPQMNEDLEQLRKQEISEAIKDEKVNEEPIEKLNEEKSSTPQIVDNHEPKSVEVESQSKAEPQVEELQASENMKVPASSQEFCMDLNLNIAASVALAAAVPVAICEQATKKANHASSDDHQRFTKNASTSSIHNDLKAILEESKESSNGVESSVPSKKSKDAANTSSSSSKKKSSSSKKKSSSLTAAAAAAEASDDANKTTSTTAGAETSITSPSKSEKRERKHRSKQSKSGEKKSSKSSKSAESSQLNVLEMLMKTAMEAAVATTTATTTTTTVTAARQTAVKETVSPVKQQRNSHRYSRELLLRIRDERAKLIDNCCPDIFRTHAYCISGAFWDPEKYFNAILHGERLHDFVNNNHSDATVLNANTKAVNLSTSSASSLPYSKPYKHVNHSPQQHYRMSPRNNYNNKPHWAKTNKPLNRSQNGDELLQSLMSTKSESAGSELLDMLKRGNSTTSPKQGFDLMDMLNKKQNLFNTEVKVQPRQTPVILTAQELEFNQLFNKKQSVSPSSGSSPSLSASLSPTSNGVVKSITEGDLNLLNSSDAYKQLVKNLSNHPLSRPDKTTVNDLFNSVIAQKKVEEEKESSKVLKQLLHLNLSEQKPNRTNNKYNYYNRNQRQYNKPTSKSSSTYARRSHNSSFNNEANLEDLILNKLKHNSPESQTNKNEQEHFKMLLNKLVVANSSSSNKPDDIMKWFRTSTTAQNTTF